MPRFPVAPPARVPRGEPSGLLAARRRQGSQRHRARRWWDPPRGFAPRRACLHRTARSLLTFLRPRRSPHPPASPPLRPYGSPFSVSRMRMRPPDGSPPPSLATVPSSASYSDLVFPSVSLSLSSETSGATPRPPTRGHSFLFYLLVHPSPRTLTRAVGDFRAPTSPTMTTVRPRAHDTLPTFLSLSLTFSSLSASAAPDSLSLLSANSPLARSRSLRGETQRARARKHTLGRTKHTRVRSARATTCTHVGERYLYVTAAVDRFSGFPLFPSRSPEIRDHPRIPRDRRARHTGPAGALFRPPPRET